VQFELFLAILGALALLLRYLGYFYASYFVFYSSTDCSPAVVLLEILLMMLVMMPFMLFGIICVTFAQFWPLFHYLKYFQLL